MLYFLITIYFTYLFSIFSHFGLPQTVYEVILINRSEAQVADFLIFEYSKDFFHITAVRRAAAGAHRVLDPEPYHLPAVRAVRVPPGVQGAVNQLSITSDAVQGAAEHRVIRYASLGHFRVKVWALLDW